ncbi:LysR family transcriptional regulator [Leucobacter sp. wl10]|uniref:LysR family transcriptional regulator n=1 Tax=Leucobacter sp. wl10 TaxID=2304677 RepID=UPI000E5AF95C|nr:LysR family transcriptional regulator [Leucobacter sp. wl10]RGE19406.1 LysR family transcriptional regulator [Leucobacter sp. wl10]
MSEVSLKQLRCFVAVYTERSFTKAAKLLGMKQSPVSQAIAALERQLDQRLFERGHREVTPTAAANALYPEALELRRRAESLPQLIAESRTGAVRPRLRLGAASSTFPSIVAVALNATHDHSPVVSDGASAKLAQAVENGDIDVCLIREFSSYRNEERVAFRERLVVAVPEHHSLGGRDELSPEEIVLEPVVTFSRDIAPIAFDLVASVFLQAGSQMHVSAHVSTEQAILGLVGAGAGITLVPQSVSLETWKGVRFIPLMGAHPTYPLTVRTAPGDPLRLLDPITNALSEWAREHGISG